MSVTGINSQLSTLDLTDIYETRASKQVSSSATQTTCSICGSAGETDSLDLSKPAELYSKLQSLAESDPEKLKEVCAKIAEELKTASESATGRDSEMLSNLAEKFQSVADGGDVSELKPPEPPSFSGPPPEGIEAYSRQQESQSAGIGGPPGGGGPSAQTEDVMDSILEMLDEALAEA